MDASLCMVDWFCRSDNAHCDQQNNLVAQSTMELNHQGNSILHEVSITSLNASVKGSIVLTGVVVQSPHA